MGVAAENSQASLLSALALGQSGRIGRAVQVLTLVDAAYKRASVAYNQWQERNEYAVRLSDRDLIYGDVHRWLLSQIPRHDQRSLTAHTARGYDEDTGMSSSEQARAPRLRFLYDGHRAADVRIEGHPVRVRVDRNDRDGGRDRGFVRSEEIVFVARSEAGQQAVQRLLERLAREHSAPEVSRLYIVDWRQWRVSSAMPPRDPSTVVLAAGQMEHLDADLGQFLESEALYARVGIPWHRNYLLYGPPGTGKTSTARALATKHKLHVYYLPLSDVESDSDLIKLFAGVGERSLLLLEDVDVAHASVSREDTPRMSAQGLLNALDGAVTPHGLVVVMTTNKIGELDDALKRPGRADMLEEIGYLTDEQAERLVAVMTGRHAPLPSLGNREITAATVAGIVQKHIKDMDAARAAVVEYLAHPRELAA